MKWQSLLTYIGVIIIQYLLPPKTTNFDNWSCVKLEIERTTLSYEFFLESGIRGSNLRWKGESLIPYSIQSLFKARCLNVIFFVFKFKTGRGYKCSIIQGAQPVLKSGPFACFPYITANKICHNIYSWILHVNSCETIHSDFWSANTQSQLEAIRSCGPTRKKLTMLNWSTLVL